MLYVIIDAVIFEFNDNTGYVNHTVTAVNPLTYKFSDLFARPNWPSWMLLKEPLTEFLADCSFIRFE